MLKKLIFLTGAILIFAGRFGSFAKDGYERSQGIDVLHYCFRISLNDSTDRIEGIADIRIARSGKSSVLKLDLTGKGESGKGMTVSEVRCGEGSLHFTVTPANIEIRLPETVKAVDTLVLSVQYSGIPADGLIISKNKFGRRTFFGDNWPDRARNWLPCVDHPSDKATLEFIVAAPAKYQVVSNGYLAGEYLETVKSGETVKVTHWKEDVPVPTKVMVIGVAEFAWTTAGISRGIPVQSWVYQDNREAGFRDYAPAADILTFYQDLIGPFSFEKLANVQSRTKFGGMENSGCIFYYENSVKGNNQVQSLLAHEIAHQWFGDAVTEKDWHHIWISEGFATYLEACFADSMLPGRPLAASMADMRKQVIRYNQRNSRPVIDTTITNKMELLSTNSYQKGAWVLHMLRQEVGEKNFWTGIRKFYADFRDKNALTDDFRTVMEAVSGKPLGGFFHQWLEVAGQPELQWSWTYDGSKGTVAIHVEQTQDQQPFTFSLPVELECAAPAQAGDSPCKTVRHTLQVTGRVTDFTVPASFPVTKVTLDPGCQLLFREKPVATN